MEVGLGQHWGNSFNSPQAGSKSLGRRGEDRQFERNSQGSQVIPGTRDIILDNLALRGTDQLGRKGLAFPTNCSCLSGTRFSGVRDPVVEPSRVLHTCNQSQPPRGGGGGSGDQEFKVSLGYICSSRHPGLYETCGEELNGGRFLDVLIWLSGC